MVGKRWIAVCVVLAAAGAAALMLSRGEKKRIAKRLAQLADVVSKERGDTALKVAFRVQKLPEFFDKPVRLHTKVYHMGGTLSPTEIASEIMRARAMFNTLTLDFHDAEIEIADKTTARLRVTARVTGQLSTREAVDEVQELDCVLRKVDGRWLFSECRAVAVLEK
jgi:hypothetical protein